MGYVAHESRMATAAFARFGEPCVFTTVEGELVPTSAILDRETRVQGELGQVIDPRPSVQLPRTAIGAAKSGTVRIGDRTWSLDRLIEDDGSIARFFVK